MNLFGPTGAPIFSFPLSVSGMRLAVGALLLTLVAACAPLRQGEPLLISGTGRAPDLMSMAERNKSARESVSDSARPLSGWSKIKQGLFGSPKVEPPKWAAETIEVRATAPIASDATSHVEAFLVARRIALEDVYRQIARRVAELPLKSDGTVGSLLEANPEFRDRLEKTIRARSLIRLETQKRKDLYRMVAQLQLVSIVDQLPGAAGAPSPTPTKNETSQDTSRRFGRGVELPRDPARLAAFEEAERDARLKLLERVRQERLYPNMTIGNLMSVDPKAATEVIGTIHKAPIIKARYPAPDACELVLSLDMESLSKRLKRK